MASRKIQDCWGISLLAFVLFNDSFIQNSNLVIANETPYKVDARKIIRRNIVNTSVNYTNNATTIPPENRKCNDNNWIFYKSRCFRVYETFEYFSTANKICQDNGGTLTSIGNEEENRLIEKLVTANTRYNEAWIGLRYESKSNGYEWVDKTKNTYRNWLYQRPNKEGWCAQIIPGGVWSNTLCYRKLQFVCQKDEVVPDEEDNETKILIMVTLPLSCVVIMLVFISYLCFRSHQEMKALAVEEKKISQHFVDVVANSATVAAEKCDIVQEYEENLKQAAEQQLKKDEKDATYKERKKRTYSSPNGKDKMYKQVTFV